jgi:hypothetical protein
LGDTACGSAAAIVQVKQLLAGAISPEEFWALTAKALA